MLQLTDIKKEYKLGAGMIVHALKGVNLSFRDNEFVSILGPSGCGKTTMLNLIGGLDRYTSGDLAINGRSTKDFKGRDWDIYRNHRIGFIFQSYNLIPHQTVLANVELALTIAGMSKKERVAKAKATLDKVGLSDQYYKKPNQLSGGQSQRVAIARALVNDPEILLADEPTGALDSKTGVQIMELVKEIASERLVIMVTHNPELAEEYSTRIIKLSDGLVVDDSNPYTIDTQAEPKVTYGQVDEQIEQEKEEAAVAASDGTKKSKKAKSGERAKMSFFTAFKLSLNNLFTKKARTIMTSIAGSIGIIGVSLVLAVSWGVFGFIGQMQNDMLSGNPITIAEQGFNINALMQGGAFGGAGDIVMDWQGERTAINVNATVANMVRQMGNVEEELFLENEITQDYIDFLLHLQRENPDVIAEVMLGYGLNFYNNVFTTFTPAYNHYTDGTPTAQSLASIRATYAALLAASPFDRFAALIDTLNDPFSELPQNEEFVRDQYDLVAGRFATEADEVMIVLQSGSRLSDLFLAQLGVLSQNEFMNLVVEGTWDLDPNLNQFYDPVASSAGGNRRHTVPFGSYYEGTVAGQRQYGVRFGGTRNAQTGLQTDGDYLEFTFFPSEKVFVQHDGVIGVNGSGQDAFGNPIFDAEVSFRHLATHQQLVDYHGASYVAASGIPLRVVGILEPNEDLSFGSLSSGFFYTAALREYLLEHTRQHIASQEALSRAAYANNQAFTDYSILYYLLHIAENNAISSSVGDGGTRQMVMMMANMLAGMSQGLLTVEQVINMPLGAMAMLPGMSGMADMLMENLILGPTESMSDALNRPGITVAGIFLEFEYRLAYETVRDNFENLIDYNGNAIGPLRNADGVLVDLYGRRIVPLRDEEGRFLDDVGNIVRDANNNPVSFVPRRNVVFVRIQTENNTASGFTVTPDGSNNGLAIRNDREHHVPLLVNGAVVPAYPVILPATTRQGIAAVGSNPLAGAGMFASVIPPEFAGFMGGSSNLSLRELTGMSATVIDGEVNGVSIANFIAIYATTFANSTIITEWLDMWNYFESGTFLIRPNGTRLAVPQEFYEAQGIVFYRGVRGESERVVLTYEDRETIDYTDFLGLIINMMTQLITMITIALVGFMSLSLIVSTVMIAIITYVSVVERKKEIGVIRSLGGRKLDVAYLFNAETFMIGLISGLIGIAVTYIGQVIINAVLAVVVGFTIVNFTWFFALTMVALSIILTFFSGLFPSYSASKKDPVVALRSE